jgi:hypothetical protein
MPPADDPAALSELERKVSQSLPLLSCLAGPNGTLVNKFGREWWGWGFELSAAMSLMCLLRRNRQSPEYTSLVKYVADLRAQGLGMDIIETPRSVADELANVAGGGNEDRTESSDYEAVADAGAEAKEVDDDNVSLEAEVDIDMEAGPSNKRPAATTAGAGPPPAKKPKTGGKKSSGGDVGESQASKLEEPKKKKKKKAAVEIEGKGH